MAVSRFVKIGKMACNLEKRDEVREGESGMLNVIRSR